MSRTAIRFLVAVAVLCAASGGSFNRHASVNALKRENIGQQQVFPSRQRAEDVSTVRQEAIAPNPCDDNPCKRGGICKVHPLTSKVFRCECPRTASGSHCQFVVANAAAPNNNETIDGPAVGTPSEESVDKKQFLECQQCFEVTMRSKKSCLKCISRHYDKSLEKSRDESPDVDAVTTNAPNVDTYEVVTGTEEETAARKNESEGGGGSHHGSHSEQKKKPKNVQPEQDADKSEDSSSGDSQELTEEQISDLLDIDRMIQEDTKHPGFKTMDNDGTIHYGYGENQLSDDELKSLEKLNRQMMEPVMRDTETHQTPFDLKPPVKMAVQATDPENWFAYDFTPPKIDYKDLSKDIEIKLLDSEHFEMRVP